MPLIATRGAASVQGFGEFAQSAAPNYIEDVFSTYLYNGTNSTQTVANGIDVAGKGGLVWLKRTNTIEAHGLFSSNFGNPTPAYYLSSNTAFGQGGSSDILNFLSNGFSIDGQYGIYSGSGNTYVSWTFREQAKFFDVVTWSGTSGARNISHNLGSVPGCIIVKRTDTTSDWYVYHRGLTTPETTDIYLNSFLPANSSVTTWNSTNPTSTVFSIDSTLNTGGTYVAYLFAHNAGGFGLAGTDNVITCGSYTGNGTTQDINLGFEPQYILVKNTEQNYNWTVVDIMRGMDNTNSNWVYANTNAKDETNTPSYLIPTATGFTINTSTPTYNASTRKYIYIAIRRGPMKVPTLGTSVYNAIARAGTGAVATVTGVGFTPDLVLPKARNLAVNAATYDRLRGSGKSLNTTSAAAEATYTNSLTSFDMDGMTLGSDGTSNEINYGASGTTYINYFFQRAPSFFDEVCYTGTGANTTQAHNLGVVPTLMIVKSRSATANWNVYAAPIWQGSGNFNVLTLNSTSPDGTFNNTIFNSTAPTASVFSIGSVAGTVNDSGTTYVAYLFATCPGVSKVGSYNGNGTTQTIDCGFTGGARFVLIKRTDASGPWYVYDTVRGMTLLTDPYLLLNSPAIEVPTLGSVTTVSTGFAVDNTVLAGINAASPAAYIFLAIA